MQKIWYASVGVVLFLIVGYVFFSQENPKYPKFIAEKRFEKERFFSTSPQSPFKDKSLVARLAYFAPDVRYKVEARIEILENKTDIDIKTSKGTTETYLKYAYLHFTLAGKDLKLLALRKNRRDPFLWVGFKDETSGKETYGAGRYLDLAYQNGQKKVTLDFNLAYNPYCVYDKTGFVCPIPPRENTLPTRIEAGEKDLR
jgi:uncharacterized protein